jgi:hypothetical protein
MVGAAGIALFGFGVTTASLLRMVVGLAVCVACSLALAVGVRLS